MADDPDLRQARVESLFATAEKLAVLDGPILSDTELEAEIAAALQTRKYNKNYARYPYPCFRSTLEGCAVRVPRSLHP
jgi:hypothetical protein